MTERKKPETGARCKEDYKDMSPSESPNAGVKALQAPAVASATTTSCSCKLASAPSLSLFGLVPPLGVETDSIGKKKDDRLKLPDKMSSILVGQ